MPGDDALRELDDVLGRTGLHPDRAALVVSA
jgi:hypothetical protein